MTHLWLTNGKMWTFVRLTRPIFLFGGAILYGLGVAVAGHFGGHLNPWLYLLGQVMVTSIQLTAQYANEYFDLEGDRLNADHRTWFTGGSGVLPAGQISVIAARRAIYISAVTSLLAIVLVTVQAPLAGILGLLAMLIAWYYSSPPLSLMGSGWGELSASLVVAILVPLTGYALQTGSIHPLLLSITGQLFLVHMAMLIAFELPDWSADQAVGKCTLCVRLGPHQIIHLHSALLSAAFLSLLIFHILEVHAARFVWLAMPFALFQVIQVIYSRHFPPTTYKWITLGAVALFVLTVSLWLFGFLFQ
jgi:1,4-dihydroxy-2-naphthoate polyprenyltransferase